MRVVDAELAVSGDEAVVDNGEVTAPGKSGRQGTRFRASTSELEKVAADGAFGAGFVVWGESWGPGYPECKRGRGRRQWVEFLEALFVETTVAEGGEGGGVPVLLIAFFAVGDDFARRQP